MTRTADRLLAVYLVGLVGLVILATGTGFVGVAAGAKPDCSTVDYSLDGSGNYEVGTLLELQCIGDSDTNGGLDDDYVLTSDIDAGQLGNAFDETVRETSNIGSYSEFSGLSQSNSVPSGEVLWAQGELSGELIGKIPESSYEVDSNGDVTITDSSAWDNFAPMAGSIDVVAGEPAPNFTPIGVNSPFTGTFDGNGHTITDLTIRADGGADGSFGGGSGNPGKDAGLFAHLYGGTVTGVGVADVYAVAGIGGKGGSSGSGDGGNGGAGGVAGAVVAVNDGTVTDSSVTGGTILAGDGGNGGSGGGSGNSQGDGGDGGDGGTAGGLVAVNTGTVVDSYASPNTITSGDGGDGEIGGGGGGSTGAGGDGGDGGDAGGLVGSSDDSVRDAYVTQATVTSGSGGSGGSGSSAPDGSDGTGGTSGTFTGSNTGTVTGAYWDQGTVSGTDTGEGTALTTSEMQGSSASSNMGALDFTSTWETVENSEGDTTGDGYPILQSVGRQAQLEAQNVNAYAGGDGSPSDPYEIANWHHLDNVRQNLGAEFELAADLDSNTAGYSSVADSSANSNKGFDPIGDSGTKFMGEFDGNGHSISNLNIDRTSTDHVGLFGYVGTGGRVTRVGLVDGSVSGDNRVGGLAGESDGTIRRSYVTTSITGAGSYHGGLVGANSGTLEDSYVAGSVSGNDKVGGLAGYNDGTVSGSYVTGSVTGNSVDNALVGDNVFSGTLEDSYWDTGTVGQGFATEDGDGAIIGVQGYGTTSRMQGTSAEDTYMSNLNFAVAFVTVVPGGDATADGFPILRGLDRKEQLEAQGRYQLGVSSIRRGSPTSTPTNAGSVDFWVAFPEAVEQVSTDDFGLSGTATATIDSVSSSSGTSITVTVDQINSEGTLGLDVASGGNIQNTMGTSLATSEPNIDKSYVVDNTAPGFSSGTTPSVYEKTTGPVLDVEAGDDGTTSPDTDVTYTLGSASGSDADDFSIDIDTGQITLDSAKDFENPTDDDTSNDYELDVTATDDAGNTKTQTVTVTVSDVNEAPTLSVTTSSPTFTEDGSAVSPFSSASVDVVESGQQVKSLTVTVSNVADGSDEQLTVDGSSVALTDTTTVITANNDLSASVSVSGSTATVAINGGVSESTADTIINNLAYEHTGDDPSTANDRTITLTKLVDDGGNSNGGSDTTMFSKSGSVSITSVNDAPSQPSDSDGANEEVREGASNGDSVGVTASSTDVDDADSSLTYTLTDDASGRFQIDSSTGEVTVADASNLDYESSTSHTITVEASDGSLSSPTKDFTVTITDSDETPSFTNSGPASVSESASGGTNVHDVNANVGGSADQGVSYQFTGGNDDVSGDGDSAFAIDSSTGQITINDVDDIDESVQSSFTVTVEASEGSQSATQDVTINVIDDVAPSFQAGPSDPTDGATDHVPVQDIALEFDEDVTLETGNVNIVDDGDGSSSQTLDVTSSDVTVSGSTVTVSPTSNLEADTNYHVEVDGAAIDDNFGNSYAGFSDSTTYNFQTANTDPSFTQGSSTALTIDEDGSADLTSALEVTDISSSDTLTWSVTTAPSDGTLSGVDGETANILGTNSPHTLGTSPTYTPDADFNSMDSFDVQIADTNPGTSSDTITVDVTVDAVNDAPSFSLPAIPDQSVGDDTTGQTVAGFVDTIDPGPNEGGQSISDFLVSNDDNSLFDTQPDIANTGDLMYTPKDGVQGTATVDVQVKDDGGTSNGGTDTSTVKTFDITVDNRKPSINSFTVTNPSSREVKVTIESDEPLSIIDVSVSGQESAILDRTNFSQSGSGPYTYEATYIGSSDGVYNATLETAADAVGNDGANSEFANVTVETTSGGGGGGPYTGSDDPTVVNDDDEDDETTDGSEEDTDDETTDDSEEDTDDETTDAEIEIQESTVPEDVETPESAPVETEQATQQATDELEEDLGEAVSEEDASAVQESIENAEQNEFVQTSEDLAVAKFSENSQVPAVTIEGDEAVDQAVGQQASATSFDRVPEPIKNRDPPGNPVTASQITVPDEVKDSPGTIQQRVSGNRLDELDAAPSELTNLRIHDGEIQTLETRVVDRTTDGGVITESPTPGYSLFAVTAVSDPSAAFSVSNDQPEVGEAVTLNASDTSIENGEIVGYEWNVEGLSGEEVTATFDDAGEVEIKLTVENDVGDTDTVTQTITVQQVQQDDDGAPADDGEPADDGTTDDGTTDNGPADDGTTDGGGFSWLIIVGVLFIIIGGGGAVYWMTQNH